jgi:glucokinase
MAEPVWLVADLGGTNLRLALARRGPSDKPVLDQIKTVRTSDFDSLAQAAADYLAVTGAHAQGAVISVAGRVINNMVHMTNLPWMISATRLAAELDLAQVQLVNDLGAAAAALPALTDADAPQLWPCTALPGATRPYRCVVIGAGTGLGIAGALLKGDTVHVLDTEGGHAGYVPENAQEDAVLRDLRAQFGRVSWERIVSGPGLMNLYRHLPPDSGQPAYASAEDVLAAALETGPTRSLTAVHLFCDALAAVAGDAVLMQGAWDGVYLMGSLPQAARPWLARAQCHGRFMAKGPFAAAMAAVPVRLITHPQPVLLGAACLALAGSGAPKTTHPSNAATA